MGVMVKYAVGAAMSYMGEFAGLIPSDGIRLEETDKDDDGNWIITLSTLDNIVTGSRSYRQFIVNAESGEVISMRKRTAF